MSEEITVETLQRDRIAPLRRCIVSRESMEKEALLRFVISPDGVLVPDIACKLPGRGYWVQCSKAALQKAIAQRVFVKVAKSPVNVPEDLAQQVERLLYDQALQSLALANKAGDAVQGFDKVESVLKKGRVLALIHAEEASEESVKKLFISEDCRFGGFPAAALSEKLGAAHAVHLALLGGQAGAYAVKKIRRWTGFLQNEAL